jgi:plastocyanin
MPEATPPLARSSSRRAALSLERPPGFRRSPALIPDPRSTRTGAAASAYLQLVSRTLALAGLFLVLAGCGSDDNGEDGAATPSAPRQTITITETEYALEPSSVSVDEAGTYAFEVVNDGQVAHALEVEGEGIEEETETLDPGQRTTLTVELEAGTYELYCPVGDHADRGMTGKLEIAGADEQSDDGY